MRSSDRVLELLAGAIAKGAPVSLTRQIRAAVELGILSGEIEQSARLPSVRRLSVAIGIAPGTVEKAYHDLVAESLLECRERSGFYVSLPRQGSGARPRERRGLIAAIDETVDLADGMDEAHFLELVGARLRRARALRGRVAVLGFRDVALADRVSVVAEAVRDLGVEVIGIAYEDLLAPGTAEIPTANVYLMPLLEREMAGPLLGTRADSVVPLALRLRRDLVDRIAACPPNVLFGIVHVDRDTVARTLVTLRSAHPLCRRPLLASVDDPERVADVVARADVIVVGARARSYLAEFEPLRVPAIVLAYVPDQRTATELRYRLAALAGPGARARHEAGPGRAPIQRAH